MVKPTAANPRSSVGSTKFSTNNLQDIGYLVDNPFHDYYPHKIGAQASSFIYAEALVSPTDNMLNNWSH